MPRYRVLKGLHLHGGHLLGPGKEFSTSKLCHLAQSPGTLEEIPEPPGAPALPVPPGVDVTSMFENAVEQEFRVFLRNGLCFVYDADDMQPINTEGVLHNQVPGVIDGALENDDDEEALP